MPPPRLYSSRIPHLLRPLRPPSSRGTRFFTTNTHRLLVSSMPPIRPQLPFLHPPSRSPLRSHQVPRPLSTSRRKQITDGIRIALSAYAIVVLLYVVKEGLYQEQCERLFPTPPDWSFMSRWKLRCARALQSPERMGKVWTDWARVGVYYQELIARLEDEDIDGKDLVKDKHEDEGPLVVQGVGRVGFDVGGMSEAWKIGYFQTLMGAAETAEKLDGWVFDTEKHVVAPREYAMGPGNPNPKQPPPGKTVADLPQEENCVPAFEAPEVYYLKILTTEGFCTSQRLDAALAYADWLDFKGLKETAGDAYKWATDIAVSGLSPEARKVVDVDTGILKENNLEHVTDNVLRASTAVGVHQVRRGDLSNALSVFLSVLRARRNLPSPPHHPASDTETQSSDDSLSSTISRAISFLFTPPPYPIPTRTGDEPSLSTDTSSCEEAALMLYIGEIIFASSSRESGLSWTRDAVDTAELAMLQLENEADADGQDGGHDAASAVSYSMQVAPPAERCSDCLRTGVNNWKQMVRHLVVRAENDELEAINRSKEISSSSPSSLTWWRSWWSNGDKDVREKMMQRRRWDAEEMILQDRAKAVSKLIGDQALVGLTSGNALLLG